MFSSLDDHALASMIATDAGKALMALRATRRGRPNLGESGDRLAHDLIVTALREARPADDVLSEEGTTAAGEMTGPRTWVVDPLDGTREYAEGRDDFAVHVALVVGGSPVVGAVALPADGVVLATGAMAPARDPWSRDGEIRIVVSRTRPPVQASHLADVLHATLVPMGSAGAKTAAVVRGRADAYVHAGGQYAWDSAAPVAVAWSHGLHASRLDGSPLVYDNADPWLPDLLVCRPELAAPITTALAT